MSAVEQSVKNLYEQSNETDNIKFIGQSFESHAHREVFIALSTICRAKFLDSITQNNQFSLTTFHY